MSKGGAPGGPGNPGSEADPSGALNPGPGDPSAMANGLHNGHFGHYPNVGAGPPGPASSSGSGSNGNYGHSDGEDDEDASTAGERSPSGGHHNAGGLMTSNGPSNGPASVSPSEQSLTSPAGFSSVPSIGSPGGSSIASPSTPSSSHLAHLTSAASAFENNPMASFLASEWFNRSQGGGAGQGAFKPPVYAFGGQKPQIGTDPKDSNHPLSVNQLTNGSSPGSPSMMGKPLVGAPSPVDKKPLIGV